MTLEKAIEIKKANLRGDEPDNPYDLIVADRLSIEALERMRLLRKHPLAILSFQLPGETEAVTK